MFLRTPASLPWVVCCKSTLRSHAEFERYRFSFNFAALRSTWAVLPPCAKLGLLYFRPDGHGRMYRCIDVGCLHSCYYGHCAVFGSASSPCRLFGSRFTSHKPRHTAPAGNPLVAPLSSPVQRAVAMKPRWITIKTVRSSSRFAQHPIA